MDEGLSQFAPGKKVRVAKLRLGLAKGRREGAIGTVCGFYALEKGNERMAIQVKFEDGEVLDFYPDELTTEIYPPAPKDFLKAAELKVAEQVRKEVEQQVANMQSSSSMWSQNITTTEGMAMTGSMIWDPKLKQYTWAEIRPISADFRLDLAEIRRLAGLPDRDPPKPKPDPNPRPIPFGELGKRKLEE